MFGQNNPGRVKYYFNSDWKVLLVMTLQPVIQVLRMIHGKKVTLPYAWNENDAFKKDIVDHSPKVYQTLPLFSNLKTTGVYVYSTFIEF